MKNIRAFFCIVLMALAFSKPGMSQAQTTDTLKQIPRSDTSQAAPIVNNANEPDDGMDIFPIALIAGMLGGCIGGIFLALLLFKMIRMLADRFKQQIKL